VRELADQGLFPGGTRRNLESVEGAVEWNGLPERDRLLLCDAQTSGGLLVAIAPEREAAFVSAMRGAPWPAARIGRVTAGEMLSVAG
jgi:selenide,water dikinase